MAKKKDLPAMPFYFGDWRKAPEIRALDLDVRMIWFEMLGFMWESTERGYLTINGKSVITPVIAKMLGIDITEFEEALKQMEDFDVFSMRNDGAIYSRKMVRDEELRLIKSESGKKGMKSRYGSVITPVITNYEDESESANEKENTFKEEIEPWYLEQADFWIDRANKYYPSVNRDRNKFAKDIEKLVKIDKLTIEEVVLIQDYLAEKPDTNGFHWFNVIGTPGKLRERSKNADKVKYWELILKDILKEKEKTEPKWVKTYKAALLINEERMKNE